MKSLYPVAILACSIMGMLLCSLTVIAGSEPRQPPASIALDFMAELYQPVVFDHSAHQDMFDCNACHHHTLGDVPGNAYCRRCHNQRKPSGQVSCHSCHKPNWTDQETEGTTAATEFRYHLDIPRLKGALHLLCLGCHSRESGPSGCRDCHEFTTAGRARFGVPD